MKNLDTPIQYIKGVGPRNSSILARLGIEAVSDMFYYLPFRYEDRSKFSSVSNLKAGDIATVKGEVRTKACTRTKRGVSIFQLALDDGSGIIYGVWFNQPYLNKFFKSGITFAVVFAAPVLEGTIFIAAALPRRKSFLSGPSTSP